MNNKHRPSSKSTQIEGVERPECFVIMPFTDPEGYTPGHFRRVFEDIFKPACEKAGYTALRADDVGATNLIQLDMLQRLLDSPIALCDLSTRNPNVLFELGLRQAFDKPVVLVQEVGTQSIFDIAPLRYIDYRPARIYHEVLEDQERIANTIGETIAAFDKQQGVNSLVKLLSLTRPASLQDVEEADKDPALQIIRAELNELRNDFKSAIQTLRYTSGSSVVANMPNSSLVAAVEDSISDLRFATSLLKRAFGNHSMPSLASLPLLGRALSSYCYILLPHL